VKAFKLVDDPLAFCATGAKAETEPARARRAAQVFIFDVFVIRVNWLLLRRNFMRRIRRVVICFIFCIVHQDFFDRTKGFESAKYVSKGTA
jgi:hypothetical protein